MDLFLYVVISAVWLLIGLYTGMYLEGHKWADNSKRLQGIEFGGRIFKVVEPRDPKSVQRLREHMGDRAFLRGDPWK